MPEIRHTQRDASPEIESATILIPDDADWGTGTFTTIFTPELFKTIRGGGSVSSVMLNAPSFEITLTVNTNGDVVAGLGRPDEPNPSDQIVFVLPLIPRAKHEVHVSFINWNVTGIFLNGNLLPTKS